MLALVGLLIMGALWCAAPDDLSLEQLAFLGATVAALALASLLLARWAPQRVVSWIYLASLALTSVSGSLEIHGSIPTEQVLQGIQARWQETLAETTRLAEEPLTAGLPRRAVFEILGERLASSPLHSRLSIALVARDGQPAAWAGLPMTPDSDALERSAQLSHRIRLTPEAYVLSVSTPEPSEAGSARLVELLLEQAPGQPSHFGRQPILAPDLHGRHPLTVHWIDTPAARKAYEDLFKARGEPYRSPSDPAFRYFTLRDAAGAILGVVSLGEEIPGKLDRLRSAGRLTLLTSALALVAWLVAAPIFRSIAITARGPSTGLAIPSSLVAGSLLWLAPEFLPAPPLLYELLSWDPSQLAAPPPSYLALLGWGVALTASLLAPLLLLPRGRKLLHTVARAPRLSAIALLVALPAVGATVGYGYGLVAARDRLGEWLQTEIRSNVDEMETRRAALLSSILDRLSSSAEPAALAASRSGGAERAYALWAMSGLPETGVDSAIGLFSETGDLVGSFTHRFPAATVSRWDGDLGFSNEARREPIESFERTELRRGLAGQAALPAGAGIPGWVRVAVASDLASLRFHAEHSFSGLLVARLTEAGRSLWTSTGQDVEIDPQQASPWDGRALLDVEVQGEPHWAIALLAGQERILLALRRPPLAVLVSNGVGAMLAGCLAGVALVLLGLVTWLLAEPRELLTQLRWPSRRPSVSYRLVVAGALLVATLLPAQLLRWGIERAFRERLDALLQGDARAALDMARRAATQLYWGDPRLRDADEKAELLRDLMGVDVDIFEQGILIASSRRQLAKAGVIAKLLHARAHVDIDLDGRPLSLWHTAEAVMAATPVALGSPIRRGVLAMPLQPRHGSGEELLLSNAATVRVASFALTLLSMGLAALLARGLARPLQRLTSAARQVSRGEFNIAPAPSAYAEIEALGRAMGRMAEDLASQRAELIERGRYIETILENATSGVVSLDASGRIRTANRSAKSLLGVRTEDPGRSTLDEVLSRDGSLHEARRAYHRFQEKGQRLVVDCDVPRQSSIRVRVTFLPFPAADALGTIVIVEDVSDVARVHRMAAWAEMARTVAHEIKNPLTPMKLHAEHLARVVSDHAASVPEALASAISRAVHAILEQVDALKRTATEFSLFAKPEPAQLEEVQVAAVIDRVLRGYRETEPSIVVTARVPDDLPRARAVDGDLERVLRNVVQNSWEALLRATPDRERRLEVTASAEESFIVIHVADTGPGVPPEIRARIFEPYFSTKDSGSGLGLALCRKILTDMGGDIALLPSREGAHFEIRVHSALPR